MRRIVLLSAALVFGAANVAIAAPKRESMSFFSPVAFKVPYPGMGQFMQLLVARNSP